VSCLSSSVGCFFLDTCILLSDILKENVARIEKLKKDSFLHNIRCYISDSVVKESYEKIQETCNFLGNIVRDTVKYQLEEFRKRRNIPLDSSLTSDDMKALEELFSCYQDAVRTSKVSLPSPITLIEEWTISFLGEKLDKGTAINIDQFLLELVKKLLELTSSIENLYDNLVTFERDFVKKKSVAVDAVIINTLQSIGIHKPDDCHIASAFAHKSIAKEKTVFVTLDFGSILDKRELILKQLNLVCCDPLYALYHLV